MKAVPLMKSCRAEAIHTSPVQQVGCFQQPRTMGAPSTSTLGLADRDRTKDLFAIIDARGLMDNSVFRPSDNSSWVCLFTGIRWIPWRPSTPKHDWLVTISTEKHLCSQDSTLTPWPMFQSLAAAIIATTNSAARRRSYRSFQATNRTCDSPLRTDSTQSRASRRQK